MAGVGLGFINHKCDFESHGMEGFFVMTRLRQTVAMAVASMFFMAGVAVAVAGIREGADAYGRGDYTTALKEWLPAAEQGDANALFNLGQLYRLGQGVPKDVLKAEEYYLRAAEKGHIGAQGNLGTLYYFAVPNAPRVEDALKWWQRAGSKGDARSQYMLGVVFYNGKDLPRDAVRAYAWMRLASAGGLAEAVAAEKVLISNLSVSELAAGAALSQTLLSGDGSPPVKAASSSPTPAPTPAAPAAAGYFVQVGAVADRGQAQAMIENLASAQPALAGLAGRSEEVTIATSQRLYRVQFGPLSSRTAAQKVCSELKAAGGDCFVASVR